MVGFRWVARTAAGRALLRSLAVLALGAQVSALAAPLLDIPAAPRPVAASAADGQGSAITASGATDHHHDPATCAACIAQSIVAIGSGPPARVDQLAGASRVTATDAVVLLRVGATRIIRSRGPPRTS